MQENRETTANAAGWCIPQWCAATSISRASFYLLAQKPKLVKLGTRTVIIESPADYLARIAASQSEAA
jgi:hypothetical protein